MARQLKTVVRAAAKRVGKVADGATINGTYSRLPGESLEAFRTDLQILVQEVSDGPRQN